MLYLDEAERRKLQFAQLNWEAHHPKQKGQIRIEPRRTTREAEAAPIDPKNASATPIIRGAKREHVVKRLAEALNEFHLTPFEHEGTCRHAVRSELCLEGHRWAHADAEAAALVDQALQRLRAKRPSYDEGQREYAVSRDFCAWCGSPIEDAHPRRLQSYCDETCARSAVKHRELNQHRRETRAFHAAWDVILRSKNPERACEWCGEGFRPRRPKERFCSAKCAGEHIGQLLRLPERTCPTCGTSFHPRTRTQVHCSPGCGFEARRTVAERECLHCGTTFRPPSNSSKGFCSRACAYAHRRKPTVRPSVMIRT